MDFRRLQYFIAVAEELHYGRAAERLGVAQPAVSQQIARLEGDLGYRLFERNHQAVGLTEAGRSLLADARKILMLVDEAALRAEAASKGMLGALRIGFVGSLHFSLPAAINRISRTRPDVRMSLAEFTFDQLLGAMYEEQIDLGLFRQWPIRIAMPVEQIGETAMALVLPKGHRLLARQVVHMSELATEPFVSFSRTIVPGYAERIKHAFADVGAVPRIVQEVFTTQVAMSFIAAGAGIGIMPPFPSGGLAPGSGVEFRELDPPIVVPTVAAWRQNTQSQLRSGIVEALRDASAPNKIALLR
jgi:DNA-binding transcriptional LysR family regulator